MLFHIECCLPVNLAYVTHIKSILVSFILECTKMPHMDVLLHFTALVSQTKQSATTAYQEEHKQERETKPVGSMFYTLPTDGTISITI